MIENVGQYILTKAQLRLFIIALHHFDDVPQADVHPRILQAQREAIQSTIDELRAEIAAWELAHAKEGAGHV